MLMTLIITFCFMILTIRFLILLYRWKLGNYTDTKFEESATLLETKNRPNCDLICECQWMVFLCGVFSNELIVQHNSVWTHTTYPTQIGILVIVKTAIFSFVVVVMMSRNCSWQIQQTQVRIKNLGIWTHIMIICHTD